MDMIYLKPIIDKTMKKLIIPIIMCLVAVSSFAQSEMIRVSYEHRHKVYKDKSKERVDKYILHTDFKNSTFYNPSAYFLDKNAHSDAACQAYGAMAAAMQEKGEGASVPNRSVSTYVFKSFDKQNKRVYEDVDEEYIYYEEPFDEMRWVISEDSIKNILGYDCVMGETDYHGRHWIVWFTPEIPVSDGPWKFAGLPGLVLMATDTTGCHDFIATGLEHPKDPLPEMEVPERYQKGDRIKFLKLRRKVSKQSVRDILARYPGSKVYLPDGTELTDDYFAAFDPDYDYLETDYR